MVGLWDAKCLWGAQKVLIILFCMCRMEVNVANSKAMRCQTVIFQSRISEKVAGIRCMVRGETYQDCLRRWIPLLDFEVDLIMLLITSHRCCMYGMEPEVY